MRKSKGEKERERLRASYERARWIHRNNVSLELRESTLPGYRGVLFWTLRVPLPKTHIGHPAYYEDGAPGEPLEDLIDSTMSRMSTGPKVG
jgi:hypothetical protein